MMRTKAAGMTGAGWLRSGRRNGRYALAALAAAVACGSCGPAAPPPAVAQAQVREAPPLPSDLRPEEVAMVELFERTSPSVVYLTTLARRVDWFGRTTAEVPQGTGTGFIWDDAGHVITNYHVIGGADSVQVVLHDQMTYEAVFVGVSASHDLAVLRITVPTGSLRPVEIGDSEALRVGQSVYAIGNPFGLSATLTTGIVSALGRRIGGVDGTPIEDVIQTDAAINRGNSGGPLLNSAGQVIGVNTQIASPSGASAGVGFAVPVNTVLRVVPELIETGEYVPPQLGIEVNANLNRNVLRRVGTSGVLVVAVEPGSGADDAGLRGLEVQGNRLQSLGDIIRRIDGEQIASPAEMRAVLDRYCAGDEVTVTILRNGQERDVVVRLS
jgi:S1-C subfamily serine protease